MAPATVCWPGWKLSACLVVTWITWFIGDSVKRMLTIDGCYSLWLDELLTERESWFYWILMWCKVKDGEKAWDLTSHSSCFQDMQASVTFISHSFTCTWSSKNKCTWEGQKQQLLLHRGRGRRKREKSLFVPSTSSATSASGFIINNPIGPSHLKCHPCIIKCCQWQLHRNICLPLSNGLVSCLSICKSSSAIVNFTLLLATRKVSHIQLWTQLHATSAVGAFAGWTCVSCPAITVTRSKWKNLL